MTLAIAACAEAWNIGAHLHDGRRPRALTLAFVASACTLSQSDKLGKSPEEGLAAC